jgi:hypothetical protein
MSAILTELNIKENAPRWAGLVVAWVTAWAASQGFDVPGWVQVAAVSIFTIVITTVVQKVFTDPKVVEA